ncbi:MAG: rhodanese-like domain-containing protein [Peptostreptococcaceae bacterium]
MGAQFETIRQRELLSRFDNNSVLIDVREVDEYSQGHLPQAINIPLGQIERATQQLDKNKVYFVICRSGKRSEMAAKTLVKYGFNKVYNVIPE